MDRRQLLILIPAASLAACGTRAPRPPSEMPTVRSIGLLPVKERPSRGSPYPFNAALAPPAPASPAGGSAVAPVSPAMMGMGIGLALRAAADASAAAERVAITAALQQINFSPRVELLAALNGAFNARALPVKNVMDETASEKARADWDFSGIPPEFDALLDVDLQYCGYTFEKKAGGFVPSVYMSATLLGMADGGSRVESYDVQADVWPSRERRYVVTSPPLTLKTLANMDQQAPLVRDEMRKLLASMANVLADDLDRTVKKLPKL